jgi:hypothetical protein
MPLAIAIPIRFFCVMHVYLFSLTSVLFLHIYIKMFNILRLCVLAALREISRKARRNE